MELRLPRAATLTALLQLYLVASIPAIQAYGAERPVGRVGGPGGHHSEGGDWSQADSLVAVNDVIEMARVLEIPARAAALDPSLLQDRALDVYQRYSEQEDAVFRPSPSLDSGYGQRVESGRRQSARRPRPRQQQYRGERRQAQVQQGPRRRPQQSPYGRAEGPRPAQGPRQPWTRPRPGVPVAPPRLAPLPQTVGLQGFDYGDYGGLDYGLEEALAKPTKKKPSFLESIFQLVRPKKPQRPTESGQEANRPSWEFVQEDNEVDIGVDEKAAGLFTGPIGNTVDTDQFVPTNAEYDDYNINYIDTEDKPNLPQYNMKDVMHSIANNESRIVTLKKFLSAASAMTDRAGTDPITLLTGAPLAVLSFLGIVYAISAVAILGYKYVLLTGGSNNGQALAVLPVLLIFTVPAVLVALFLLARGTLDGQINLGRLARGDLQHTFRQDFEGIDFAYDLGVGATALLGLGWMISVAV
jgi:hypothetical protein